MERSRARLFCRQSDPAALLEGLRAVESCAGRVWSVSRCVENLLENCGEQAGSAVTGLLRDIGDSLESARAEMAACAGVLEAAAIGEVGAPTGREARWAQGDQDHYPELLMVGLPDPDAGPQLGPDEVLGAAAGKARLQVAAVKDRYSVVLPGLPWVGPERDEFAGARLTSVRAELEQAEEDLRVLALGGPGVDLRSDRSVADLARHNT